VHGPQALTLSEALRTYGAVLHPEIKTFRSMPYWWLRLIAWVCGNELLRRGVEVERAEQWRWCGLRRLLTQWVLATAAAEAGLHTPRTRPAPKGNRQSVTSLFLSRPFFSPDLGIDVPFFSHRERPVEEVLPWDHIHIKYGRDYLAKEQNRSVVQLESMAGAV